MLNLEMEFEYSASSHPVANYSAFVAADREYEEDYHFFVITMTNTIVELGDSKCLDYSAPKDDFFSDYTIEDFCELNDYVLVETFANTSDFIISISRS